MWVFGRKYRLLHLVTVYCHSETCEFLCLVTNLYAFPKVKRPQKENLLIIIRHKRIHFFSENCHTLNTKKKTLIDSMSLAYPYHEVKLPLIPGKV